MCELIMVNEDLDKEIKSDHTYQRKSLRMAQRYNPADHFPRYTAKSFDIQASPTLSRRPPMKGTSNPFEDMAQRRRKKSSQCTTIVWKDGNNTCTNTVFCFRSWHIGT